MAPGVAWTAPVIIVRRREVCSWSRGEERPRGGESVVMRNHCYGNKCVCSHRHAVYLSPRSSPLLARCGESERTGDKETLGSHCSPGQPLSPCLPSRLGAHSLCFEPTSLTLSILEGGTIVTLPRRWTQVLVNGCCCGPGKVPALGMLWEGIESPSALPQATLQSDWSKVASHWPRGSWSPHL